MKKIFALLTVVCFVAVNVSLAQTTQSTTSKETQTESVKPEAEAKEMHRCCKKSTKACCKSEATTKNCSSKEKAACAKDGAKAEAKKDGEKAEAKKETKSGTN